MQIGILPNADKDDGYAFTREVCAFLRARGHSPIMTPPVAEAVGLPDAALPLEAVLRETSFTVVLGGDGTILRASHRAALCGAAMLGINLGTLGYLTDVERHEGLRALDKALNGECHREKRLMLTVSGAPTKRLRPYERIALNDICVSRGGFGKLIAFQLFINGQYMDTLRADGVIVATPTGSTAYNLSAGGPILTPDGDMMVITAVCPHALYTRPWVVNARDTVLIRAADDNELAVSLDGEQRLKLVNGEGITVKRSSHSALIMKTSSLGFYEILRQKIGCEAPDRFLREE